MENEVMITREIQYKQLNKVTVLFLSDAVGTSIALGVWALSS